MINHNNRNINLIKLDIIRANKQKNICSYDYDIVLFYCFNYCINIVEIQFEIC